MKTEPNPYKKKLLDSIAEENAMIQALSTRLLTEIVEPGKWDKKEIDSLEIRIRDHSMKKTGLEYLLDFKP